jgi:predicted  nucleic acid-binding Zn-ribbon protein
MKPEPIISQNLLEEIRGFSATRDVRHCGETFETSSFDVYATCPRCGTRIKVRSFSGWLEIEDVFDAVFEWLERTQADAVVERRRCQIREDLKLERP